MVLNAAFATFTVISYTGEYGISYHYTEQTDTIQITRINTAFATFTVIYYTGEYGLPYHFTELTNTIEIT